MPGALKVFFKEGLETVLISIIIISYLRSTKSDKGVKFFFSGLILGVVGAISAFLIFIWLEIDPREELEKIGLLLIGILFSISVLSYYIPWRMVPGGLSWGLILAGFLLVFLETLASFFNLKDISFLKEKIVPIYAFGVLGVCLALIFAYPLMKLSKKINLGNYFTFPILLYLIATIKLWGSKTSLIISLQEGLIKLIHDTIHYSFVLFLIPDHPFVKFSLWNFIGILFAKETGLALAILFLIFPGLLLLFYQIKLPLTSLAHFRTGAERRRYLATMQSEKHKKYLVLSLALCFIIGNAYAAANTIQYSLYDPEPTPVVDDGDGSITIPLNDSIISPIPGRLKKYAYNSDGTSISFLVVRRADGSIGTTLDACRICEPEGYAQQGENIFCKYCKTPISLSSVGEEGGCNPIPIKDTVINDSRLRIPVSSLMREHYSSIKK